MTTISPTERKCYVRGAIEACVELHVPEHIVMEVCQHLRIMPEELKVLAQESTHVAMKAKPSPPFAPGMLGEVRQ
jgi:hypothetical protein